MSFQNANQDIQIFVDGYGNIGRNYSVIDYVMAASSKNTNVTIDPKISDGKARTVKMNYFPIQCGEPGDCSQTLCSPGEVVEPAQAFFKVGECIASPMYAINKDDIRLVDNARWDFTQTAKNIIASAFPNFRRQIATAFLTKMYTLAGVHLDGATTKRIATTDPNGGIINPVGKLDIEREYLDGGFGRPHILGGTEVYYWNNLIPVGGVNQNGINIGELDNNLTWYDDGLSAQILNDLANGEHLLAIDPQVFKFVTFSENAGIFRTDLDSIDDLGSLYRRNFPGFLEGTLLDPVTGLLFDLYIRYDECNSRWTFMLKLHWDMFVMPDIACNVQGVNGVMHYRTCPAVQVTCPSGSPVSSPAAPTEYAWTPTLGDIPVLSQAVIGGDEYKWNTPLSIATLQNLADAMNEAYSPGTTMFSVSGSDIVYTGYTAIGGSFNNGDVTFTFA